jgi:hypothetical protein
MRIRNTACRVQIYLNYLQTYLRHIETNDQLHHGDHDVDDGCPPVVKQLAGLPGSLMAAGTLSVNFKAGSDR